MIDLDSIKALVSQGVARVGHDTSTGASNQADGLAVAPAVLMTADVTDAVKDVSGDRVLGSVNREELWAVTGFELDAAIIRGLPSGGMELNELIDRVQDAGYAWRVVSPSGP